MHYSSCKHITGVCLCYLNKTNVLALMEFNKKKFYNKKGTNKYYSTDKIQNESGNSFLQNSGANPEKSGKVPMKSGSQTNQENKETNPNQPHNFFSKTFVESGNNSEKFYFNNKRIYLYKTELCRGFSELGYCKYGDKCQFSHSPVEQREISRHPKYKTETCRVFWEQGTCPYGKRCCFLHSNINLDTEETIDPKPQTLLSMTRRFIISDEDYSRTFKEAEEKMFDVQALIKSSEVVEAPSIKRNRKQNVIKQLGAIKFTSQLSDEPTMAEIPDIEMNATSMDQDASKDSDSFLSTFFRINNLPELMNKRKEYREIDHVFKIRPNKRWM